ncbi:GSCOCG00012678001-RA-CDS [Cotesia congregata]|uniref:MULE transposase domain-containing protein n=1 Tax=Cotesia congregata TaxID=51543 RepID=A0A8J2MHC0_COTCN|nr:GSCOCG00012678001-RA-CDS [Cotesia congregata]CAG5082980.1 Protein of unknown function [Cotesia congregata]
MNKKIFNHLKEPRLKLPDKFYNGYGYSTYHNVGDVSYIRCFERNSYSCGAHGKFVNNKPQLTEGHNHEADPKLHLYNSFQQDLFKATLARPFQSFRLIYDHLSILHYEAAVKYTWAKMKPLMESWRRRNQPRNPPTPHNLQQYSELLSMPEWSHLLTYPQGQLRATTLRASDGSLLTMLCNSDFLRLVDSSMLFMDATFRITSRKPKVYQVFTILGLINDRQALPLCWVLMTRKTTAAYRTALSHFKNQLAPHINPETIMTDFEIAEDIAIKDVFPEAIHIGCFFHYCQALTKRLEKLGLMELVSNWKYGRILIRKMMALALLPSIEALEGYQWIMRNIPENIKVLFGSFFSYYHDQWIKKTPPELWSIYGHLHRTNNLAESYHKKINLRFGTHPPIWKFTESLKTLQAVTHIEYLSLRNGENIVRQAPQPYENEMDIKILKAWQLLNNKTLDVPHFLACASKFLKAFQRGVTQNLEDENFAGQKINVPGNNGGIIDGNFDHLLIFQELDIMQDY